MRRNLVVVLLMLSLLFPLSASASPSLAWSLDVGPGYITTSPVVDEDRVYVRTSGFWTGDERPNVLGVNNDGTVAWQRTSPTTVQHDMAPLLRIGSGTGACGAWPELLLVGWADGRFEALHPSNGSVVWATNTTLDGWGITGAASVDGDHVVVPLRNGLARWCLADGRVDFEVATGLGWRNGVTVTPEGYWLGDEAGNLWHVGMNGTVEQPVPLPGALRHAPLLVEGGLLLHTQNGTASALMAYNLTTGALLKVALLGASPAVPLAWSTGGIFADSDHITSVQCAENCTVASQVPARVNGEMGWTGSATFHAPQNTPEGGWLAVEVTETGMLSLQDRLTTPYDGYGTSAPAARDGTLYLGNDAGVLMALQLDRSPTAEQAESWPLLGAAVLMASMGGAAALASKGRFNDAWRWLSVVGLCLMLMLLPDLNRSWNATLAETASSTPSDTWDPSWPERWMGTQVVVFEFEDGDRVIGGLVGHDDVLALTQTAAQQLEMNLHQETSSLGTYVVAINGTAGSGWEYFVDGQRGVLAVDDAPVDSTTVLVWRLA
jgi:hypothetical protein